MAIEEKVIQPDSVNPAEQPVAETASQPTQPQAPNLDSVKAEYENQLSALKKQVADEQEKFKGIKTKLDDVYKQKDQQRKQELEDQGQWKTLWEEANKTAQEREQQIINLSAEYVGIEPPEVKISRDFDIERLIGQDITALTSLFDQQVIDREEFRDILVQGEVLPSANEAKSE